MLYLTEKCLKLTKENGPISVRPKKSPKPNTRKQATGLKYFSKNIPSFTRNKFLYLSVYCYDKKLLKKIAK